MDGLPICCLVICYACRTAPALCLSDVLLSVVLTSRLSNEMRPRRLSFILPVSAPASYHLLPPYIRRNPPTLSTSPRPVPDLRRRRPPSLLKTERPRRGCRALSPPSLPIISSPSTPSLYKRLS
ncbi:uncharacterized protein SCHCODRAFT_02027008 [Schizophyllum commune H4-8]|uniref:uncharacterized protein n=1 Tax=Schizophyllum commune (strain H4-8 / FGSC 9210) TaxID=578458 RepID=UPI00215E0967|nr:uncharacterized protein SCHCODRAFT_02027008 [Schizophyllum commune H4-8]KAI5900047.1 hypothetical protein SCHCODRAFT_02027008 [Schizophyllum commune H4-8]